MIPSANSVNATAVNSHHHLHGGMTRPVHTCCPCMYPREPPAGLICRPCRDDITRVLANPCRVPRRRKVRLALSDHVSVGGFFVVSVLGRPWHSVAIDESHEMLINKDCKTSIVRPLPDFINRIARYIPYRSHSYFLPRKTNTK